MPSPRRLLETVPPGERRRWQTLATATVAVTLLVAAIAAGTVGFTPQPNATSEGPTQSGTLDSLHQSGVTGSNVTVGVIDTTGFDRSHPRLDDRVDETRRFGITTPRRESRSLSHGTASAALVARTAPDARFLLASVDSYDDYRAAVDWLLEKQVDVILAPQSFLGRGPNHAGSGVVERATRSGVVFVAPTGNLATGTWRGTFDPEPAGQTHQFRTADETNEERAQNATRLSLEGDPGRLTVWLSWEAGLSDEPFSLSLYRHQNGRSERVARSTAHPDDVPNQRLVARTGVGDYYLVVRGPATAAGVSLELESPTHRFEPRTRRGSIAPPATAHGVLAVGAVDDRTGAVETFSGRGPSGDGRLGVDVVAPDRQRIAGRSQPFVGTSASAAYTAGVVALLLDVDSTLTVREVETVLERTATPIDGPGPDATAGYGRVDPAAAVNATRRAGKR